MPGLLQLGLQNGLLLPGQLKFRFQSGKLTFQIGNTVSLAGVALRLLVPFLVRRLRIFREQYPVVEVVQIPDKSEVGIFGDGRFWVFLL